MSDDAVAVLLPAAPPVCSIDTPPDAYIICVFLS